MRTCYLTCGFVNLLCSADACSPLIESWVAGVMVSAHSVAVLEAGARRASKSPKTISPCLDPAKRLEAYLAAEGVPLEAGASTASCPPSATAPSLSTKWETFRYGRRLPSRGGPGRRRRPNQDVPRGAVALAGVRGG